MKDFVKNVKNLLKERGFKKIEQEEAEKASMILTAEFDPPSGGKKESVMVYVWDPEESVGVAAAREIVKTLKNRKIDNRFVVGGSKFTRMAKEHFEENDVEYISTELVMLNILEHKLVPKHRILSEKETKDVLDKLKVDKTQLPSIYITDPVAKIIGAREGDIIEVIRKSKTAGTSIAYRNVIKEPGSI